MAWNYKCHDPVKGVNGGENGLLMKNIWSNREISIELFKGA